MPSAEEARKKEIIRRWFEDVWNHRHADLIAELRAPDAVASGLAEGQADVRGDSLFKRAAGVFARRGGHARLRRSRRRDRLTARMYT